MANTIPDNFKDLLEDKTVAFANLATVMPDGTPQVTPIWFDTAGDKIRINSARGRVKDRNIEKNPNVALSIVDPQNPYRHIAIRGKIVSTTEQGARDHINKLAKKYVGKDVYPGPPNETRVMYEIEPTSVSTMG
jgi:PPOX class probable F420-dependent enzyme